VTTDLQNYHGISSGITSVQLKAYDTSSGLVAAEVSDDAGFLGIRGSGSVSQAIVLPRKGSYKLVSTAFENGKRKGQGEITVYNLERLTPDSQRTTISISDIDFLVQKVAGDKEIGIITNLDRSKAEKKYNPAIFTTAIFVSEAVQRRRQNMNV